MAIVVPLIVRESPQGATWGADVLQTPGLDLLRASLERRLPDAPVTKLTGLRLSEVGLGTASAWMPATTWWQSGAGVFFAGTTAFVADMALSGSVLTSAPAGMGVTTSELSVNFLRVPTIRSQTIIALKGPRSPNHPAGSRQAAQAVNAERIQLPIFCISQRDA